MPRRPFSLSNLQSFFIIVYQILCVKPRRGTKSTKKKGNKTTKMIELAKQVLSFESLNTKMARLKRKMIDLESREKDVNTELNFAESLLIKKRKKSVDNWLSSVGVMKERVAQLGQQVEGESKYNFPWQLQNSVDKIIEDVKELIQDGVFPGGVTFEDQDSQGFSLPTMELVGQKFEDKKNMIRECLKDDNILSIGLYGMGGVGKTTLLTHIHNELLTRPHTSVFWVTVSQNSSIHKLQNDIARVLHADLKSTDDERKRAAILAEQLKRRNNCVLILDDLWDDFPPESVGIINGVRCKLILTTRSVEVCHRMGCHRKIIVKPLSKEEAWTLFRKKLGAGTTLTPEIEKLAKSLAKECAGLPLGIITVAGSMRGVDDVREWSDALETMRQSTGCQDENIQLDKVFHVLRYSYDALKSLQLQECFLYCSLFPEDEEIIRDQLIAYFIDEGLIKRMGSRQAEFNRGHTILNKLEKACLLQSGRDQNGLKKVKMHDLVRDMALRIASERSRFLVEAGLSFVDVADEEKWSDGLERVSFIRSHISDIPSRASPRCPKISTLLLWNCHNITAIPDSFFTHMNLLTVLDLSYTEIEILPSSIANLKSLSALLLKGCGKIKMLFPISDLPTLKRLDLSDSRITELPQGLEMLSHLRDLNLSGAKYLKMIPEGILSKLSNLQCLELPTSHPRVARVRGEEIASLKKLETFKGKFYNTDDLDTYLRSWEDGRPNEYLLQVGEAPCFGNNKEVCFGRCHNLVNLCNLKSLKNASDLKICSLNSCDGMRHVFCQDCYSHPFIQSLECLLLFSLRNLHGLIWTDTARTSSSSSAATIPGLPAATFSSLKLLEIQYCPQIKKLFSPALISHLENLEKLNVSRCEQLEEIVRDDNLDEEAAATTTVFRAFTKLKRLTLWNLPELNSFCSSRKMVSDSLENIFILGCPKLERFPLLREEPNPPKSLRKITANKEWWESVEFDHPNTKDILAPICHIY